VTTPETIAHLERAVEILRQLREPIYPKRPSNSRYQRLSIAVSAVARVVEDLR
jgi:GH18 family chitinase